MTPESGQLLLMSVQAATESFPWLGLVEETAAAVLERLVFLKLSRAVAKEPQAQGKRLE